VRRPDLLRTLERYFDALRSQDWESLASCLSEDLHRTGPYLDEVRGRQPYVDYLARVIPSLSNYELKGARMREVGPGSAVVALSESVDLDGARREFPEVILFDFDAEGRIHRVDVYIKQPPP